MQTFNNYQFKTVNIVDFILKNVNTKLEVVSCKISLLFLLYLGLCT